MLKLDKSKAQELLHDPYGKAARTYSHEIQKERARQAKTVTDYMKDLKKPKPRIPEPQEDPKPKLYRIDWVDANNEHKHRYVAAIDKVIAATLFEKKYAKGQSINNISINRVPSEWKIRFPVLWDRIGIAIEETQHEAIAAAKKKEAENAAALKEWVKLWKSFWDTLSAAQEDDMNMWTELRKMKVKEWIAQFLETWSDIGQTKWANRTMFDFLEVD